MIADILSGLQRSSQVHAYQVFRRFSRGADDHLDAVFAKQALGPLAHAPGDDGGHPCPESHLGSTPVRGAAG